MAVASLHTVAHWDRERMYGCLSVSADSPASTAGIGRAAMVDSWLQSAGKHLPIDLGCLLAAY